MASMLACKPRPLRMSRAKISGVAITGTGGSITWDWYADYPEGPVTDYRGPDTPPDRMPPEAKTGTSGTAATVSISAHAVGIPQPANVCATCRTTGSG